MGGGNGPVAGRASPPRPSPLHPLPRPSSLLQRRQPRHEVRTRPRRARAKAPTVAAVVVVDGRRLLSRRAPRSTSPRSRTRRERLRVGGCHRRRVGSAGRGGGASRGAHVPRGSCAEADGRRTGGGSRPPSPCRVCAAPAREAVESSAAQPIRAMSVRGTDRTRQCPLCGHGQAGAVWSGDLQGAHRGCVNARFRETACLTGYPPTRVLRRRGLVSGEAGCQLSSPRPTWTATCTT